MVKIRSILALIVILALIIGVSASFLVNHGPVAAQGHEKYRKSPLNPDFVEFFEHPPKAFYGYIPPTMDLSHLKEIPMHRMRMFKALPNEWDCLKHK